MLKKVILTVNIVIPIAVFSLCSVIRTKTIKSVAVKPVLESLNTDITLEEYKTYKVPLANTSSPRMAVVHERSTGTIEWQEPPEEFTSLNVASGNPKFLDNPGTGRYLGKFKLTAYCPCRICNGKWTGQPTALGTHLVQNRTVAVDKNIIPLGSHLYLNIPGDGWQEFVAEDTGSGIVGNRIDVFVADHASCYQSKYNSTVDVCLAD